MFLRHLWLRLFNPWRSHPSTHTHTHLTTNPFNQQQKTLFILSYYKQLYQPEYRSTQFKPHTYMEKHTLWKFQVQNMVLEFHLLILICFSLLYFRHTQCALTDFKTSCWWLSSPTSTTAYLDTKKVLWDTKHVQNDKNNILYIWLGMNVSTIDRFYGKERLLLSRRHYSELMRLCSTYAEQNICHSEKKPPYNWRFIKGMRSTRRDAHRCVR